MFSGNWFFGNCFNIWIIKSWRWWVERCYTWQIPKVPFLYYVNTCRGRGQKIAIFFHTCKSLLEALILAPTNPQHDKKNVHWFTSSVHENNELRTCCVRKLFFCFCFDIKNNLCTQHVLSLFFSSSTELLNQWTILCHIVG